MSASAPVRFVAVILAAWVAISGVGTAFGQATTTVTYTITACIDGEDQLLIRGGTLQWLHKSWQAVGITNDCASNDVTVLTAVNGSQIQSATWHPTWPGYSVNSQPPAGATSSVFAKLAPALAPSAPYIALDVIEAREQLTLAQLPTADNEETLILDFDDSADGAAATYTAQVSVSYPAAPLGTTIYDTLMDGDQRDVAWQVNASFVPGAEFQSPGNFALTQINVALAYGGGTDSATVRLLTLEQGVPGTVLGSWPVAGQSAASDVPPTTIDGITGVFLQSGQNYVLQVAPGDATTSDGWLFSNCCGGSLFNGEVLAYANYNAPAYSLLGSPVGGPDTYANGTLTVPVVAIGSEALTNLEATVDSVVTSPVACTSPRLLADRYDPTTRQLTVRTALIGNALYCDGVVTLSGAVAMGGAAGTDVYDGTSLAIPRVHVLGGLVYDNVVLDIAGITKVDGGIPTLIQDVYIPELNELIIPAVEVNGQLYTNVAVSVGAILSVGTAVPDAAAGTR